MEVRAWLLTMTATGLFDVLIDTHPELSNKYDLTKYQGDQTHWTALGASIAAGKIATAFNAKIG